MKRLEKNKEQRKQPPTFWLRGLQTPLSPLIVADRNQ